MRAALWLAARELSARRGRAALAIAVVAVSAALVSAGETASRAREEAVARDLDAIGPSLLVVPFAAPPHALARHDLGGALLPDGAADAARRALGWQLRRVEARRVLRAEADRPPVVAVERDELPGLPADGAAAGAVLAERLRVGGVVEVAGRTFRVEAVRPSSASPEDLALFVRLDALEEALGARGVNVLRLHLAPGADARDAAGRLGAAMRERVVRMDRGEIAEAGLQGSLARHRLALYAFSAAVAALALLVAAQLDAAERRTELATLVAIGAAPGALAGAAVARSALVAVVGAVPGVLAGAVVAVLQDPEAGAGVLRALPSLLALPGGAVAVGVAAAVPSAVASARRDPVPDLQEAGT